MKCAKLLETTIHFLLSRTGQLRELSIDWAHAFANSLLPTTKLGLHCRTLLYLLRTYSLNCTFDLRGFFLRMSNCFRCPINVQSSFPTRLSQLKVCSRERITPICYHEEYRSEEASYYNC
jgi:hypothetical protein